MQKVAFLSLGGIGDFVLHLEIVQEFTRLYPTVNFTMFCSSAKCDLGYFFLPTIEYVVFNSEGKSLKEFPKGFSEIFHLQWFLTRIYKQERVKSILPNENIYNSFASARRLGVLSLRHYFDQGFSFRRILYQSSSLEFKGHELWFDQIDYTQLPELSHLSVPNNYVLLSNEADLLDKQTKTLPHAIWVQLINALRNSGLFVIEVGVKPAEVLKQSNYIDARGQTSIMELCRLIKESQRILAIEGGVAHLAAALNKRAVILTGPTSETYYGHKIHSYVSSGNCLPCVWQTIDWYKRCMKSLDAVCMKGFNSREITDLILSNNVMN